MLRGFRKRVARNALCAYAFAAGLCACAQTPPPALPEAPPQRTDETSARYEGLHLFSEVLRLVRENYVEDVDEERLLEGAVRGMLRRLDPHSVYMNNSAFLELERDTRGEFVGVGIKIIKAPGEHLEIISPVKGAPAARAGILARDRIVEICPQPTPEGWIKPCRNTKAMDLNQAALLLRGPRGSEVRLRVRSEGEAPRLVTLRRGRVQIASVEGRLLESGYAYLSVLQFQERTARELRALHRELEAQLGREFEGLVLDLRNNPGGLLEQAVDVADLFLPAGRIVSARSNRRDAETEILDSYHASPQSEGAYPMAVLINRGSASAAEIVAGALQDNKRALIVGAQSFGKASVQTLYPLPRGAGLSITTALYYTPNGRLIQETGIEPDVLVSAPRRPLFAPAAAPVEKDGAENPAPPDPPDPQLQRALELLKSRRYFDALEKFDAPPSQLHIAETPAGKTEAAAAAGAGGH